VKKDEGQEFHEIDKLTLKVQERSGGQSWRFRGHQGIDVEHLLCPVKPTEGIVGAIVKKLAPTQPHELAVKKPWNVFPGSKGQARVSPTSPHG
jgi:hypothetical protein